VPVSDVWCPATRIQLEDRNQLIWDAFWHGWAGHREMPSMRELAGHFHLSERQTRRIVEKMRRRAASGGKTARTGGSHE
jgi:hypothetical protein